MKLCQFATCLWIILPIFSQAQVSATYCNGQPKVVQGDPVYADGTRMQIAGEALYPNGVKSVQVGAPVFPNGQRMSIGDEDYHMSGQRVSLLGDLYYPNGQRVQIGDDCFFQSGVKMNRCPLQVRFEDLAEGVFSTGVMDLKTKKVIDRSFEFRQLGMTTTWKVDTEGTLYQIQTRCDQSLL